MKRTINLPVDVEKIIDELEKNGFTAYAVGGCVRDSLMGKIPEDWDICTSAKPEQTKTCFKDANVIETGIKHGTLTVRINHQSYEITTYRVDGEYLDNRRPTSVRFVDSLREDLSRRDFTINAMAYNSKTGIQDFYGGCEALRRRMISCVGDGDVRFGEDALRIMRALRFASVLEFSIEDKTSEALHRNKRLLRTIAMERINAELCKVLCGENPSKILREYSDVLIEVIPELEPMMGFEQHNPHHQADVWEHTLEALKYSENQLIVRLALLLHDVAKPQCYTCDHEGIGHFYNHGELGTEEARKILRKLKFDNSTIRQVCELVRYHDVRIAPTGKCIRRWLNKIGEEQFKRMLLIKHADMMGQSEYMRQEKLQALADISFEMNEILEKEQCYCLKDLAIHGEDLISLGITDGKKIGETLDFLLNEVIEGKVENDKNLLMNKLNANDKLSHNFQ